MMQPVPIPYGFDNYGYLLVCGQRKLAVAIDPGEAYPFLTHLEQRGVALVAICATHHHRDHVDGIPELLAWQPGTPVYGQEQDASRLPVAAIPLAAGDSLEFGPFLGTLLHTPGHTAGSCCYLFGDWLFTGDTLFGCGCGRLFEGEPSQMYNSLLRLGELPDHIRLYFGHEYTRQNLRFALSLLGEHGLLGRRLAVVQEAALAGTLPVEVTMAEERQTNPFLRCHDRKLLNQLNLPADTTDGLRVFTELRNKRDSFQ